MNAAAIAAQQRLRQLPQAGLIAAYDFTRMNHLNWSEDLTQATWGLIGTWTSGTTRTLTAGFTIVNVTASGDGFIWSGMNLSGNTAGVRVHMRARVRGSGAVRLNLAEIGGAVPAGDLANGTVVTLTDQWQDIYATGVITTTDRTGIQFRIRGNGPLRLEVQQVQGGYGADAPYEKTTDGQILLDRSVRLWPAPAARNNLLSWSEDATNAAWSKSGTASASAVNTLQFPTVGDAVQVNAATAILAGQTFTFSVELSGTPGEQTRIEIKRNGATGYEGATLWVTLTAVPTRYSVSCTFAGAHTGLAATISRAAASATAAQVTVSRAMLNLGATALPYERQTDGTYPDHSQRGSNLMTTSDFTSSTWGKSGCSVALDASTGMYRVTVSGGNAVHTVSAPISALYSGVPFYVSVDVMPETCRKVYLNTGYKDGSATFAAGWDFDANAPMYSSNVGTIGQTLKVLDMGGGIKRLIMRVPTTGFGAGNAGLYVYFSQYGPIGADGQTALIGRPMASYAEIPYASPPAHATLGSSAVADPNDPAWTAQGLSFDGADDFTATSWPTDYSALTVIAVGRYASGAASQNNTIASQWTAPSGWLMQPLAGNALAARFLVKAGGNIVSALGATPWTDLSKPFVQVGRYNGQKVQAWYQGAEVPGSGSAASGAISGTSIGYFGRESSTFIPFRGELYFFAIYNRALSDAEVAQVYRFIRIQLSKRGVSI